MKNLPLLLGTIITTLVFVFGIAFFFSREAGPGGTTVVDPAVLLGDSRHVSGAQEAQVTIVEFSDLECPACKAAQPLVKQLLAEYPEQVKIVFRHFPLDQIHPNARTAALATEVAAQYELFWEYHDLLFDRQQEWAAIRNRDELRAKLGEYAEQLEIDKTEFLTKIENQEGGENVQRDVADGLQAGVSATPTFFVNGQQTTAPQLRATVESAISTTDVSE